MDWYPSRGGSRGDVQRVLTGIDLVFHPLINRHPNQKYVIKTLRVNLNGQFSEFPADCQLNLNRATLPQKLTLAEQKIAHH
jgi:hypothetical protein